METCLRCHKRPTCRIGVDRYGSSARKSRLFKRVLVSMFTTMPQMNRLKKKVKASLGALAAAGGLYRRSFSSRFVVTAFHRVNDQIPEDPLTCSSVKFEQFCAFFQKHFRVVPLRDQVRGISQGVDMGGTLSITFDDGYADNLEVAAPVLKKYGLPATFFVTTGFIGSDVVPFWDTKLPKPQKWMTWDQVRELSRQGFDVGCHTVSHLDMGKASPVDIRNELQTSKAVLESELGRNINLFAYPFGGRQHISDVAIDLVREASFLCCASCHGGTNDLRADSFRLRRIGIADWFSHPHQFGMEVLMGSA